METQETVSRRQLLSALGTSWVAGVAGCGRLDDFSSPEINEYAGAPTARAGELVVSMQAEDDEGLRSLAAGVNEHMAETSVDGAQSATLSDQKITTQEADTLTPFEQNTVTYRAEDTAGNVAQQQDETYVRKYDTMEDSRLDISAIFISQQGSGFIQECRDSYEGIEPTVGIYDEDPIPREITDQHIDQMTGHGINRILYDHAGKLKEEENSRVETFLNSSIINHVTVEPFYTKVPLKRNMNRSWRDILSRDLPLIRDAFLIRDNAATIAGRPVFSTWNFIDLAWNEEREKVMAEFGSFDAFVDEMRSHLRLDDGTDPFLILGKGPTSLVDHDYVKELVIQFDGITTWTPSNKDQDIPWGDILQNVRQTFSDNARFARNQDMEFTPTVIPGYNELGSGCGRSGDKHVPRNPKRFQQMLELAEEYATSDRIDIATWNDWTEGTQIEPGTFGGNQYSTAYLEIVEAFQRGDAG